MADDLGARILDVLEQERRSLLAGAFEPLEGLEVAKLELFARLSTVRVPAPQLAVIRSSLEKNQTLMAAAIHGVKAARMRLDALESVKDGLAVYDQSGAMSNVAMDKAALRKKA